MTRPADARRAPGRPAASDVRCDCGALLARVVGDRIVLKCRRCKRVVGVARITALAPCCGTG